VNPVVVDSNYFLGVVTSPGPTERRDLARLPAQLFELARTDVVQFTTSEAVLAEVIWVMTKQYGLDRETVVRRVSGLLSLPGCRFPSRQLCKAALGLWVDTPALDFPDALVALQAEEGDADLATLDRRLARLTKATIWEPPAVP